MAREGSSGCPAAPASWGVLCGEAPGPSWRCVLNSVLSPSLHKVLFTEQPETYYKWDNWPPESDRK